MKDNAYFFAFIIVFLAGLSWSFGAVVVRHMENANFYVFKEWLSLAVLSGQLDFADYSARPLRYCKPRWTPPAQHFVDPLKEVKAYREAEQAGYMTKSQVIAASNGGDYDDIVAELAREKEIAEEAGVV